MTNHHVPAAATPPKVRLRGSSGSHLAPADWKPQPTTAAAAAAASVTSGIRHSVAAGAAGGVPLLAESECRRGGVGRPRVVRALAVAWGEPRGIGHHQGAARRGAAAGAAQYVQVPQAGPRRPARVLDHLCQGPRAPAFLPDDLVPGSFRGIATPMGRRGGDTRGQHAKKKRERREEESPSSSRARGHIPVTSCAAPPNAPRRDAP